MGKQEYLIKNGWKEVPSDYGKTSWQSPVSLIGTPHVFSLDDAYALEVTGETYEYAGESLLIKMRHDEDVRKITETEALEFANRK